MSDSDIVNVFAPLILALVFCGICYVWARSVRRGKPLTRLQRTIILYATIFAFGMAYMILFQDALAAFFHWTDAWIGFITLWGVLLAVLACWRGYANRADDASN